jgi:predicted acylesterase/phospholipase RssA
MEPTESTRPSSDITNIGLSLSGGGFRATLFHLGVVRFLYESGLLKKVTHICSVSGGSVLAAHLVLNWNRYTGSEDAFENAAKELVEFTQKDVRGRVFRRWGFSLLALGVPRIFSKFSRVDLLEKEYNTLYDNQNLTALLGQQGNLLVNDANFRNTPPQLHILASSMTNGQAATFGPATFQIRDDDTELEDARKTKTIYIDDLKVALAVTASSAFPPAFPPVSIDHKSLKITNTDFLERYHSQTQFLTDGGVFDNLGLRKFKWIQDEQNIKFNTIIVSDAQREFEGDTESKFKFIVRRATRSTDLLMNRVSWLESDSITRLGENLNCRILRCQLKKRLEKNKAPYSLELAPQLGVHNFRTDLDSFTDDEVNALVHHGYAVARFFYENNITSKGNENFGGKDNPVSNDVWVPIKPVNTSSLNLVNSGKRKISIFSISDIFSWLSIGVLTLYLVIIVIGYTKKVEMDSKAAAANAASLKEANEQTGITLNSINLIDSMAKLAMQVDYRNQDSQEALEEWNKQKEAAIASNPFFNKLFNEVDPKTGITFNSLIDDSIETWRNTNKNTRVRSRSFNLGNKLGKSLIQMNNPYYKDWLKGQREIWYQSIEQDASKITDSEKLDFVYNASVKRFWQLYLGRLCLVEGKSVEAAMVNFGDVIKDWEDDNEKPPEIHEAFYKLQKALNEEKKSDVTKDER